MVHAVIHYISMTLLFSVSYMYVAIVPVSGEPIATSQKNLKTESKTPASENLKKTGKKGIDFVTEKFYNECGDGDSDEEDIQDCIDDCEFELAECLTIAGVGNITALVSAIASCASGNIPLCIISIIGFVASIAAIVDCAETFQDCRSKCIEP